MIDICRRLISFFFCSVDIISNDLVKCSVFFQFFDRCVEFIFQLCVAFFEAHCIIFFYIRCLKNLQSVICIYKCFCRLVINNNCIDLSFYQCLYCICTFIKTLYMIITEIIRTVDIACCTCLNTNLCILKIICTFNFLFFFFRSACCHRTYTRTNQHYTDKFL